MAETQTATRTTEQILGNSPARELLQDQAVLTVPLPGGEFDVDTPEDLERLRALEMQSVLQADEESTTLA